MSIELSSETAEDWWEVEDLFDRCFAPGREALSSYRLRDGISPVPELCLVARDELNILAGAIRFWPVRIGERGDVSLLLGPVAVHPTRQGEGLGRFLIEGALDRAIGWDRALLVGDAPYYGKFGFRKLEAVRMPPPTNPERVLGRALSPGAWDGVSGKVTRLTEP